MKRYLLFAGDRYYPKGGMEDFVKDFKSIAACRYYSKKIEPIHEGYDFWSHIYDTKEGRIILEFDDEWKEVGTGINY